MSDLHEVSTNSRTDHDDHADHAPPEAWDSIADAYAQHVAPGEQPLSREALEHVGLRAGETFLDVAAGPGGLALAAARMGATVLATDWAPRMVAQLETQVRAEGLAGTTAAVMDAHHLDLEDASFDVTGSQFGVMLVPDQARALREMVRVTRPGGRVLIVGYGDPGEFEALQAFIAALQTVVPEFDGLPDPPPLEFQVADPDVLRERLQACGLRDVTVEPTYERITCSSGQDVWTWMLSSNPIAGAILGDLDERDRARVRASLDEMIRGRVGAEGTAELTAAVNIGWGRRTENGPGSGESGAVRD